MEETDKYERQFQEAKKSNPSHVFVDSMRRKVFRLGDSVIKFGPGVDAQEAQTMQFVRRATKVPVPETATDGANVIVMDYVEGCNLQECWQAMSDAERQCIAEQMSDILHQLRGLKGDYIGAVDRGPAVDMRRGVSTGGPFDSESEFNKFLLDNMISTTPLLYYQSIQQMMRNDHNIVFSHGDLNLHNIIVKGGEIVALLDWETAGWYPEHWEYIKFCKASIYDREWHRLGPVLFPKTYPDELVLDQCYAQFVF